ncbi:MAG: sulfite exporter TauE/SafE family protein [Promethearchaeota archaeon]|nr:MAG: sulfite exporter TauE/SafE family protein [Candidatus Lokiarchaeota archaeon]
MPLGEEFLILAIPIGLLIGTLCSIVGLGGGVLIIPVSVFLLGFNTKSAIVISLFSMTGLTISASITYVRKRMVNYRLAILYNIWDLPGVILGGIITLYLACDILAGICGIIIISLGILLFRRDTTHCSEKREINPQNLKDQNDQCKNKLEIDNPYVASFSSFSGGIVTGLVGLGGGTTDTTSMILLGMEPKRAAATSEFAMASTAFFGVFTHFLIGTFNGTLLWPIFMSIGTIIGAQVGTYFSTRIDGTIIRKLLACLAAYTGILLILLMFGIGWNI